jgi:hypothetical protein
MTRFTDGPALSLNNLQQSVTASVSSLPAVVLSGYEFLFHDLQANPKNRLPENNETASRLIDLGRTMLDPNPLSEKDNSDIPSAYTYFGQFIDHDLTRQMRIPGDDLKPGLLPLSANKIPQLTNSRSPLFDLDCIYGPPTEPHTTYIIPRQGEKLVIEAAQDAPRFTDLPRDPTPNTTHGAYIGDRRNDEHLIISQMHVAFLRAHNALVDDGASFDEARTTLRRIYQYIVINDYLRRIADPTIVKQVLDEQLSVFDPRDENVRIPLEFSVAAFRTAHSMIRNVYNYNELVPKARLFELFLPGPLMEFQHIIAAWVIDWPRYFDGRNMARLFRPKLAPDLIKFLDTHTRFDLATIDLLKGYLFRLPTGEAIANRLGLKPMSFVEISEVTTSEQQQALLAGGFKERTPLWFYLLCEAAATEKSHLGRVGSIIVASVIISLVRKSKDSYMRVPNWTPFDKGQQFGLADLFQFAGVLPS